MSMISCGGFEVGEGLSINNGVLSASGSGATVVTFTVVEGSGVTATHTVAEVTTAMQTGLVIGKLIQGSMTAWIGYCMANSEGNPSFFPFVEDGELKYSINVQSGNWHVSFQ